MYGGGGFGFGYQSPQDTDPFTPGVQTSLYDHDPTRPGIQAAGSVNKVPHISGPGDTNPYIAGNQPGYYNPGVNNGMNPISGGNPFGFNGMPGQMNQPPGFYNNRY